MKTIRISIYSVKPGMVAAADVYSSNNQLLVPKGSTFTKETLDKLNTYSVPFVSILSNESDDETVSIPSSPSYSERIQSSPEFQRFQSEFTNSLEDVNRSLQHIVTQSDDINVDELLDETTSLLTHGNTTIGVLDLLNNLRSYDDSTYAHSLNVSIICRVFGQWLNMNKEDLDVLTVAGLLHDLGKLLMPPDIIKKPGRLTNEEFEIVKKHPYLGYKHVQNNQNLDPRIKSAMLMHHEKCDGSGYPAHLTGNKISPFAKIVAIADVYDAMTAKRVYRDSICPFHVIEMFEEEGYQKYDVQYLLPFLESIVQTYLHNHVRLSDGRIGEIIFINKHALSRPIIRIDSEFIDLSENHSLNIQEII